VTRDLYTADETSLLPEEAVLASLGCGNPTALIELQEGQTVLDLGSGGETYNMETSDAWAGQ
jgi:arsenite methyltransferase